MKTSTKAILGVYGAFVGVWLAGSAYFLANGRDEELEKGLLLIEEPLPREENAYYLFPNLHEQHQTNFNFAVANDFMRGWTNSLAIRAEIGELVAAHSNLFACARRIIACRGYQVPEGESMMAAVGPLCGHPTARLYQMKAMCEALGGDRKAAQATLDELIAFGRFVRRTGTVVGYLFGESSIGMAVVLGGHGPIGTPEDGAWRRHLVDVVREQEASVAELSGLPLRELACIRQRTEDLCTNTVKMTNFLLRDGLEGLDWLTRNASRDGVLSFRVGERARINWGRVDRSCVAAVLACCPGYSRYSLKPNAVLNEMGRRCRRFAEKIKETNFDRAYAEEKDPDRNQTWPFHENWLADRLMWNVSSVYRKYYGDLFGWRAGRLRLAVDEFHAAKGRYPAKLAELVPDFMEALPRDPYDGEPIRYNAEYRYVWTPGLNGTFNGKVDFDEDGYPRWKNRNYHFVQLLDMTKRTRPPDKYRPTTLRRK